MPGSRIMVKSIVSEGIKGPQGQGQGGQLGEGAGSRQAVPHPHHLPRHQLAVPRQGHCTGVARKVSSFF